MLAIKILTFSEIFNDPQACCDRVCGHAASHGLVMRASLVSARWTLEIDSDGTRRLLERWSANQQATDEAF